MPTQPKNSIVIYIRLEDELTPLVIPLNLLASVPSIIQAHIFQSQAHLLMESENEKHDEGGTHD